MSQSTLHLGSLPHAWTIEAPSPSDQLGESVVAALSRPLAGPRRKPWGPIRAFLGAAISLGLLPLIIWPKRFRDFAIAEQQQLWHLAEWLRLRTGDDEAVALRELVSKEPSSSWVFAPFVAAALAGLLLLRRGVYTVSYAHIFGAALPFEISQHASGRDFYVLLLSFVYFLHWLTVCERAGVMRKYTQVFSRISTRQGLPNIKPRSVGLGINVFWSAGALVGIRAGMWWAIPAMLAGVVHYRYIVRVSRLTRLDFAQQARTLSLEERPRREVANPMSLRHAILADTCPNLKCAATLPLGAHFCTRCGSRCNV